MKYHAPEYDDGDSSGDSHGSGDRRKMAGDCPSQLSDERTELLELQWRDGCPVEQPVHDQRSGDNDDASSPGEKKSKTADDATAGEAVEEWWKMWREGESGGRAAAAAHGYPQFFDDLSSVNAKAATASVAPRQKTGCTKTAEEEAADELWRHWREGHGSSAPQDSSRKTSVLKGEDSVLPSSAASRDSGGAQRHSSEQIDQECSTLDHAIEYMKSLQHQIQVLSHNGYGMQPLLFPCICSQPSPHPAAPAAPAPAATLYPAPAPPAAASMAPLYQPPPPPQLAAATAELNPAMVAAGGAPTQPAATAAELNQAMVAAGGAPPQPAAATAELNPAMVSAGGAPPQPAAATADLNPVMMAAGGAPGTVSGPIGIGTGLAMADDKTWSTSEIPFGGCARCSFRRRAGDC